jgi:hypothetical protein
MSLVSPPPTRKHPRYGCDQMLRVRYRANGQEFIISGRCKVVGKGGIGAVLPAELEVGQEAYLEISVNNGPASRRFKAEVRNRQKDRHGFQFKEADERSTAVLTVLFRPDKLMAPPALTTAV